MLSVWDLSLRWAAVVLLCPVLNILALIFTEHPRSAVAAKSRPPSGPNGTLEIGFLGSLTTPSLSTLLFQRVLLNVVEVRVNPSAPPHLPDIAPALRAGSGPPGRLSTDA